MEVIHRIDDDKKETPGVISQTAAKVAKDAVSGSPEHKSK